MAYLLGTCPGTFDVSWNYDGRIRVFGDIKFMPDDPFGSPQTHPHPFTTTIAGPSPDGYYVRCFPYFGTAVGIYTDASVGNRQAPNCQQLGTCAQTYNPGAGLVRPDCIADRAGQYPMNRIPVRTYNRGFWCCDYGLPIGWFIFLRLHPSLLTTAQLYSGTRVIFNYMRTITAENRIFATNNYWHWGNQLNQAWTYFGGGPLTDAGYLNQFFRLDIAGTNAYVTNSSWGNSRQIFQSICSPCL